MEDYSLPAATEFTGDVEEAQRIADEAEATAQQAAQQEQALEQGAEDVAKKQAESDDPRQDDDGDGKKDVQFNPGDIGAELSSAIGGGLQDAASSVATLPERAVDMLSLIHI